MSRKTYRYPVCYKAFLPVFLLLASACAVIRSGAQTTPATFFSNIRTATVPLLSDSLYVDSLSVVPGSFFVRGIPDSLYAFYPERSLLVWVKKPQEDSVTLRYRVFPLHFYQEYSHKNIRQVDSNSLSLIYRHREPGTGGLIDLNELEYTGSYGRSIALGNNQDVVLNSSFNLQMNGYILDSIRLEAALTDNTIPFQPEGNTQRLQEFDQIYIRLSKKQHSLQLGDYNLDAPPGYFLKFFKRVQGVYYQTAFPAGKKALNKTGISGSIAKGQFARNIFQGVEGNQGPYKLTGNNGEQFFIILAGTERVYIDNIPMERGESADYVINYNTGEVRFMPRRMITKDSRIQVEFEYQDRNYLNSLVYAWNELSIGDKWNIRLNAYSNQDAKNQPYLQQLNGEQKRFLADLGDSVHRAYYPSVATDTFAAGKILYKIVDTAVNGQSYDTVFVYSTNPDSARYALSFSYVGENRGDYLISPGNANGRVYEWVAPVNGIPQGSYAPVQLLVAPKKQQVFILTTDYRIDSLKQLSVELGASNTDPNLFSGIDNQTHWGAAARVTYREKRYAGAQDSTGKKAWTWDNSFSYEYVQDRFQTIGPYRNVEFGRDWNVPSLGQKPDEHLVNLSVRAGHRQIGTTDYQFSWYQRGEAYAGMKHVVSYDYSRKRFTAGATGNILTAADTFRKSRFWRPSVHAAYLFPRLGQTWVGARYEAEQNDIRGKYNDSLQAAAFAFDVLSAYIRNTGDQPAQWSLTYSTRKDQLPVENAFREQSRSHNGEVKLALSQWKNHMLQLTSTYRQLIRNDTAVGNRTEESLLGRLEYSGNLLKRAVSLQAMYEFGSGQEQKQAYTYVEVPAGQGMYTWIDYNGDGVQQANEFEIALYPDQKRFIRMFTPTNEYVKVNYMNYNLSLLLEPAQLWGQKDKKPWQRFVSRFSSQSSVQAANRLLASEGLRVYNPFASVWQDTAIIVTNSAVHNSVYFNRSHPRWGLDYNLSYQVGKQLLIYGVETSRHIQHLYKLRWNLIRPLTLTLTARNGSRSYASGVQDKRTFLIKSMAGDPSLTWLYRSVLRITGGYRWEERKNAPEYGGETAVIQTASMEIRYSLPATGVVQLRGTFADIRYDGLATDPVAFSMLDALQKGSNYLWYLTWERKLGRGIEVSLEYEGRKPGSGIVIHTGRMSVRAIL